MTLTKFQRLISIAATGAIRSSPSAALEVLLDLPPLHLYLETEARTAALRLKQTGMLQDSLRSGGHSAKFKEALKSCPELSMPQDRTSRHLIFNTVETPIFPDRDEWLNKSVQASLQDHQVWYTDGSFVEGRAGAGVYCNKLQIAESISLGKLATVFQAEVLAIREAMEQCLVCGTENAKVAVCSDSQAAILAIASPDTRSKLVLECKEACRAVRQKNILQLLWVPGHCGVEGNEEADRLAKEGAAHLPCAPEPILGVSMGTVKSALKCRFERSFRVYWEQREGLKHSKQFIDGPSTKRTRELLNMSRKRVQLATALLTGHGPFRAHLARLGVATENTSCRHCGMEEESARHLLLACPALWSKRLEHLGFALEDENTRLTLSPSSIAAFAGAAKLV